jgi:ATP-dependent Clp protease ATP-binding subunit ClpA
MLLKIFNIQLKGLTEALNKQGIELVIDDDTRKMLAEKGFTPKYGARQVAGTIRTYLRRPISRLIVGNKLNHGQKLVVGKDEKDELTWEIN